MLVPADDRFPFERTFYIVTMGPLVATTGEIRVIDSTTDPWQVRGYGWNGRQFRHVGRPTAVPLNPAVTDTSLTTGDLVFGPPADGIRHGTLSP